MRRHKAHLPHSIQFVQNIGSKTLIQVDHEQWGRTTIDLALPETRYLFDVPATPMEEAKAIFPNTFMARDLEEHVVGFRDSNATQ